MSESENVQAVCSTIEQTCLMVGTKSLLRTPRTDSSTGTSRHPTIESPFAVMLVSVTTRLTD